MQIKTLKICGGKVISKSNKVVSSTTFLYYEVFDEDEQRNHDYYFYQIGYDYIVAFLVVPSNTLTTDELNSFLSINIY